MIEYGLAFLAIAIISFLFIIYKILTYVDWTNIDNHDEVKTIMDYISDIGIENFEKIQVVMQIIPMIISGSIILISAGLIWG